MRNEIQNVQAGNAFALKNEGSMRIFFKENGCQDVTDFNLLLFGRSDVIDRSLDHPLKCNGLLKNVFGAVSNPFQFIVEKFLQRPVHFLNVAAAVFDYFDANAVVQDGEEDVFDTHILVAPLFRFPHGQPQGYAEFLAYHLLFFLHGAFERKPMFPRQGMNGIHFGFSNFKGKNAAEPGACMMDIEHDTRGLFRRLVENRSEDLDDKVHRRVIVVEEQHPIQRRFADFRFRF